jgi:hypothetical protein
MRLSQAVIPLFEYPIGDLDAVLPAASEPIWDAAQFRQRDFKPHSVTRSIIFSWLHEAWRPGAPAVVLKADHRGSPLSVAVEACAAAIVSHLPGTVVSLMLVELAAGAAITPHEDIGPLTHVHRCHAPIVSNQSIVFRVDGEAYYFAPGVVYEFDNTRLHSVENRGAERRVHLICDVLPSA